jgi:hypothetical protein
MTCPVTEVCVLCDLEHIPYEYRFLLRIIELTISYWRHDPLTVRGRDMQHYVPGNDVARS